MSLVLVKVFLFVRFHFFLKGASYLVDWILVIIISHVKYTRNLLVYHI